ncbi:MAG: hypothetical protein AB1483_05950 [Candidatus Zixiibacteriota bacterium]
MRPVEDKTKTHVLLTGGVVMSHYRVIEKIGAGAYDRGHLLLVSIGIIRNIEACIHPM